MCGLFHPLQKPSLHSYQLLGLDKTEPFFRLTGGQVNGGDIAVDCFFIISGYLITASFFRSRDGWDYLMKRVRRIYPAFIVAYAASAWLVPWIVSAHPQGVLTTLVGALTLHQVTLSGIFPQNALPDAVDTPMWTIRYEFACYLLVAALAVSGVLARRRIMVGTLIIITAAGATFPLWGPMLPAGIPQMGLFHGSRFMPLYMAGMVACLYRDKIQFTPLGLAIGCLAIAASAVVHSAWRPVFVFAGAYVVLGAGIGSVPVLRSLIRYGDFSYGIYLYACPVQQLLIWAKSGRMGWLQLFFMATPITVVLAASSWYLVERRFLQRVKKTAHSAT